VKRLATPLAALAIFLLNVLLNWPLFLSGELPFRGSIEDNYIAIARFVSAHPNPWGWNPFQYCGLPTRFLYVPALPYLTAAFAHLMPHFDLAHIYRIIVSAATCAGPVAAYFFALHFTKSRRWSLIAALVYSLLSPSYGLFPAIEKDRGIVQLPWRVQVLALWIAARRRGYPPLLVAALLLAATPLVNWVGAFALAMACVILLLASLGEPEFRAWRVCAAGGLGYLLACFWLTPTFIRTIVFNWPTDSFSYHFDHAQHWLLAGMVAGVLVIRVLFRLFRGSFYFCFVTMAAFTFGWIASVFYLYGLDTIPESRRYAIEFELFLALALVEAARLAMQSSNSTVRLCAMGTGGVLLLAGMPQLWAYTTQGWRGWMPVPREQTIEFHMAQWMADHPPEGRVFASGGLRFRLNSWFDLPQVGGGFETGLTNRMPWDLAYHVRTGKDSRPGRETADTLLQLKAMNTQYVVIHGPKSREYYRDYIHPERITAALTPLYHEEDDAIYGLPARPLANLVSREELPGEDAAAKPWVLERYVAAMEDAARPVLQTRWLRTTAMAIDGAIPAGRLVAVRVNADPGWRAAQDGREIPIEADNLGFIVLRPAAVAATRIELEYRATAEPRIMAAVCALAWIAALAALIILWRQHSALPTTN
jgi:hypothetical protein